jgi:hypothetical protein
VNKQGLDIPGALVIAALVLGFTGAGFAIISTQTVGNLFAQKKQLPVVFSVAALILAGIALAARRRKNAKDSPFPDVHSRALAADYLGGVTAWLAARIGIGPLGALSPNFGAYLPGPLAIGIGVGVLGGVRGGLIGGLAGGFISSLVGDPLSRLTWPASPGVLDAICNGIAFGIVAGAAVEVAGRRIPATAMRWSMGGTPVGVVAAMAVLTTGTLYGGWAAGIPLAAATGIAVGVANGFVADPEGVPVASPRSVLARDRMTFLVVSVSAGFSLWAATAAVHARETGALNWLVGAAWLGFFQAAWSSFNITRIWLAATGRIPWRLHAFLEDAKDRGILRQIGAVYRFRSVELQNYLSRHTGDS